MQSLILMQRRAMFPLASPAAPGRNYGVSVVLPAVLGSVGEPHWFQFNPCYVAALLIRRITAAGHLRNSSCSSSACTGTFCHRSLSHLVFGNTLRSTVCPAGGALLLGAVALGVLAARRRSKHGTAQAAAPMGDQPSTPTSKMHPASLISLIFGTPSSPASTGNLMKVVEGGWTSGASLAHLQGFAKPCLLEGFKMTLDPKCVHTRIVRYVRSCR